MAIDKKTAKSTLPSIILRLSRGRTLKVTFRPRIRLANILVKLLAAATGLFALSVAQVHAAPPVNALPTGGQVVYGNTSFQQTSNTLNVNQASQSTIINWQSFNIGAQSTVNFNQPNSSAVALNRILGDNASQIYGQLNANGNVFLLNPNGMLFAPGSQVNVGGLLASTMHISDSDFIAGNYRLTNSGAGFIDSQGHINANSIAFAGNNISNSGNLYATNVSLVAGNTVAVDISGGGLIRARVESPALQANISNSGNINAVQQVTMTAGQSRDTLNSLVNNSGTIRATGLSNQGGVITLQGGKTLNSGVLDASSATGKGGTVAVLGEHVGIVESGSVIATGATGGGTILVGGDFQGKNPDVFNASRTYVGANTTLNADAINTGNGGKVIVWANDITRAYGNISARGGSLAGNGGFVEVSGKHNLDYRANTDTRALNGQIGTLLLDPDNIVIDAVGGDPLPLAGIFFGDSPGTTITLLNSLISASNSTVILQALSNINFNAPINMTSLNAGLTVQAGQIINVNSSITTNGGIVDLTAGALPNPFGFGPFGVLKVNAAINTTGSANAGANVLLTNLQSGGGAAGGVQLNGNITAGTGTVFINNTGDAVVQNTLTGISANNLQVISGTSVSLTGNNDLTGNLAANITGLNSSFTYKSNSFINDINVGTVGTVVGITTNNGAATLTSAIDTNLNINQAINLGTGNLSLNSSSSFSTAGDINALNKITAGGISAISTFGNILIGNDLTATGDIILTATEESTVAFQGGFIDILNNTVITANNITATGAGGDVVIGNPFATTFTAPIINATGNINLLATQGLASGGNINVAANINHTGTAASTLDVTADQSIVMRKSTISSPNSALAVTLASDFNGDANGTIGVYDSIINSNGGNITLGGGVVAGVIGAGYAVAAAGGAGVFLQNSTLIAGGVAANGGNIEIRGLATNSDGAVGVSAEDSNILTSAAGTVNIDGQMTGNGGTGTRFFGTSVQTANGSITLNGNAPGNGLTPVTSHGVLLDASLSNNITKITSTSGDITIVGERAGTGNNVAGITIQNGTLIDIAATGNVTLVGTSTGVATGIAQRGILVSGPGTIISAADGSLTLVGDALGLSAANSDGILVNGGAIIQTTGTGALSLTGASASVGIIQAGISIGGAGTQLRTANGAMTLDGVGNGAGTNSFGVVVFDGAKISSTGAGNIDIYAIANNFTSAGLAVDGPSSISIASNFLTIAAGNNDTSPGGGDQIRFDSAGGASINGNGAAQLRLNPINNTVGIGVGTGSFGTFNLNNTDIAAISNFLSVSIGSNTHTGAFDVASLSSFAAANNNTKIGLTTNGALMDFSAASSFFGNLEAVTTSGDVAVNSSLAATTGGILINSNDALTINTGGSITATGNIDLVANSDKDANTTGGGDFINNVGTGALATTGLGSNWRVYSYDVAGDNRGGLVYDFKQYNANYGGLLPTDTILGTGNGFIYSQAAGLTVGLLGPVTKVYDGNNTATLSSSNFTFSGGIDGDSITFAAASAVYNDKNVNTGKNVTASGVAINTATNGLANVYGYQISDNSSFTAAIGDITQANLTLNASSITKTYDGTTSAVGAVGIVGLQTGDSVTASQSFASKNVLGTNGSTVSVNPGFALNDGNSGNNYIVTTNSAQGTINKADATVIANSDLTKVYNGAIQSVTGFTATGLVGGELATVLTGVTTTGGSGQNAGSYVHTASGTDSNYNLAFTAGNLNIAKANLAVSATGVNKPFDGTTLANVILADNRITGDVLSFTNTANFFDSAVGTGKQIDVLGINISGADAGNYNLVNATAIAFADITAATVIPPPTAPTTAPTTTNSVTEEANQAESDVIDKTQNLELVLLPVKITLPSADEYVVTTDTAGKELSCK